MDNKFLRNFLLFFAFIGLLPTLNAADTRTIPLDMYVIIDDSEFFRNSKRDAMAWLNNQVLDRILVNGDKVTIWAAGDSPKLMYSEEYSSTNGTRAIKENLEKLSSAGKKADFTGALKDATSRITTASQDRLQYAMVITASAGGLEGAIVENSSGMLKWSRSEKYERWQVLVAAPHIGSKVQQAASAFMSSLRQ